jgi:hypothetical protein
MNQIMVPLISAYKKISRSVIQFVPVDMMHHFPRFQFPADLFLCSPTVEKAVAI